MSNKTRKHIWPGALVLSIAIVGVLAAFVVLAGNPGDDGRPHGRSGGRPLYRRQCSRQPHRARHLYR